MTAAAPARPSASVLLVRDGPDGLETFMLQRHARSRVSPSVYVFPGGTVRADDRSFAVGSQDDVVVHQLLDRSDAPLTATEAIAYVVCALRELFEEAGVLLALDAGRLMAVEATDAARRERLAARRLALQADQVTLATVFEEFGLIAAFEHLVPFSHWVTPTPLAARFETRFFVAHMPPQQEALHCTIETSAGIWRTPRQLLAGGYELIFVTEHHLRRIAPLATVAELLAFARAKPIRRAQPLLREGPGGTRIVLPPELVDAW